MLTWSVVVSAVADGGSGEFEQRAGMMVIAENDEQALVEVVQFLEEELVMADVDGAPLNTLVEIKWKGVRD